MAQDDHSRIKLAYPIGWARSYVEVVLLLSKLCIELEQMDYISCPLDIIYDNPLLRKRIMILL